MVENIFGAIGIMIIATTFFAIISKKIKQPLIPSYILTGLVLGPILGIIHFTESIQSLSDIGIAFLLFIVGMELDYKKLRKTGKTIIIGGTIQNIIMILLGYGIALLLGLDSITALYFAFICAFSSTMIVIKMLSDNNEIDTLHGKFVIGFLLVEDFFALLALSTISQANSFSFFYFVVILIKVILLLLVSIGINKYLIVPLFNISSKSKEVLFLMGLTSAFFFSFLFLYFGNGLVFILEYFKVSLTPTLTNIISQEFSIAMGAFIAGIGLGSSPYVYEIIGKINTLRDFFATLFFVALGIGIEFGAISGQIYIIVALLFVFTILKPFLVYTTLNFFGYTKRTGYHSSIYLTQLSEFSLILLSLGVSQNTISNSFYSAVVIAAVISIIISSYLVKYDKFVFNLISPLLNLFDLFSIKNENMEYLPQKFSKEVLLIGYDRIGYSILKSLKKLKKNFLVIDYNPDIIHNLMSKKIHCIYGDIVNPEIMERVHIEKIKTIISTVPDMETNKILLSKIKRKNKNMIVILTAYDVEESLELYELGANYVILPHLLGGNHVSFMIEQFDTDIKHLFTHRKNHLKELKERIKLKHHHHR